MNEELAALFIELLKPLFPPEAEICRRPSSGELVLVVDWKLKNDSVRPNKRSRKIIVQITHEIIEDYADGTDQHRRSEERRIAAAVKTQLNAFEPEHNSPRGTPEPEETWVL
ncbi:MAG: hypothetical protein ACYCZD_03950 [Rhodanobacter sp.]